MKIKMKKMVGIILSFALVLGLMPGMNMTAYAASEITVTYDLSDDGKTINKDGVTCTEGFDNYNNITRVGTFTTSNGKFTKIVVNAQDASSVGRNPEDMSSIEGWSSDHSSATWTGNSASVQFGAIMGNSGNVTITFTIELSVDVTDVSLNINSTTLTVGGTETLTATVSPDDATDNTITWSSNNTAVATVSNGVVTAVAEGSATITATATNGTDDTSDDKTATCAVTVTENNGDTQQNPDGTKTVTKENADGKTISVTNYSKTDEQISQFVFEKAKGTTLDLTNVNSKTLKTVVVPESVKANGNTYKVTRIRKGFLKNCKQATKVDICKNVNTIDKKAFNYGKKVQKVVIRGKLKKVGKNAFKNTKKNVVIKVKTNAKNFKKNKTLLEKSGLPKNATVKRVKNKK